VLEGRAVCLLVGSTVKRLDGVPEGRVVCLLVGSTVKRLDGVPEGRAVCLLTGSTVGRLDEVPEGRETGREGLLSLRGFTPVVCRPVPTSSITNSCIFGAFWLCVLAPDAGGVFLIEAEGRVTRETSNPLDDAAKSCSLLSFFFICGSFLQKHSFTAYIITDCFNSFNRN